MKTTIAPLQTVTSTGPLASADVSQVQGDFSITIRVTGLAPQLSPGARIVIEESLNAFANSVPMIVLDVPGVAATGEVKVSWRRYQIAMSEAVGMAGGLLRVNVALLKQVGLGGSASLEAWIDS